MTRRRLAMVAGLLGLIASAARPAASAPVEVEGTTYGGTASGGWACGPDARAKYGGIGGEVRVHPLSRDESAEETAGNEGLSLSFSGAAEHRVFSSVACGGASCTDSTGTVPSPGVAFGTAVKLGGDYRWVGVRGGLLAWQNWDGASDRSPSWNLFPEFQLRLGRVDSFRVELGVGSYSAPTVLRPGVWAGIAFAPAPGWDINLRIEDAFTSGVGDANGETVTRGDLVLLLPVTDELQLGFGGALTHTLPGIVDPEGRVMLVAHVW